MYLLYLDESGNEDNAADRYFVLGGAAVFERTTYHVAQALDGIQARHFPGVQPVDFHAVEISGGKGFWRRVQEQERQAVLAEISAAITAVRDPGIILLAAAVEKDSRTFGEKAVEVATEQVCKRFDTFLGRRFREYNDPQRGLIVFAEGRFHQRAKTWVNGFRTRGTSWGVLNNLSDIPYFASAKETRLLQLADFVAYSVFQLFERRKPELIRPLLRLFSEVDGTLHGLVHVSANRTACECPACTSRRTPGNFGPWI